MLFAPKEKGQGLVEYAIILTVIIYIFWVIVRLPDCSSLMIALQVWLPCD